MSGGKRSPSIAPLSLLRRGRDGGRVGERGSEGPHAHLSGRCCCAERRGGRQTHGKYWSRVKYSYSTRARAGFQSHKLGTRKHTRACTHKPPVPRESLGKIRGAEGWALERGRDAEREEEGRSGAQGKMLFSRWQAPSPCPLSLSVFHMLSLPSGSVYYVCTPFFLHHPSHQCLHLCAPFAVADFLHLIHDHRGWDADLRRNADNNDHQGPFFQKSFHRSKCVWWCFRLAC